MRLIIADSSTLIALLDTGHVEMLFRLFEYIMIADEVYKEITHQNQHLPTIQAYIERERLSCHAVEHDELYDILSKRLDAGETESIILAKQHQLPLLIDEKKGIAIAKSLHIPIVGMIGVMLKLMDKQLMTKDEVQQILRDAEANHFRMSASLKRLIDDYPAP